MYISPNNVAFVRPSIRIGVLPELVRKLLKMRVMSKEASKAATTSEMILRSMCKQHSLKIILNVIYGYTAAGYTGHMPFSELGESIVGQSRQVLEKAIFTINNHPRWSAQVVYGDTDSVFVMLKGRTKDDAFRIGHEIADVVSALNPQPIKLKLEKVYMPCFLQTKKRYVGYMWETPTQVTPTFCAKGIETIRRSFCPLTAKGLEECLRCIFDTRDLSCVKAVFIDICRKALSGECPLSDFVLTGRYRGLSVDSSNTHGVLSKVVRDVVSIDPNLEPNIGERFPYVVVMGDRNSTISSLAESSHSFHNKAQLCPNSTYYITKQVVPPLSRFLSTLNVDVSSWYAEVSQEPDRWNDIFCQSLKKQRLPGRQLTITQLYPRCSRGIGAGETGRASANFGAVFSHSVLTKKSLINSVCRECCLPYLSHDGTDDAFYERCCNYSCRCRAYLSLIDKLCVNCSF